MTSPTPPPDAGDLRPAPAVPAPAAPEAPGAGRNPLAWWGFGLAFGSLLAAVAGAALALSIVGLVVARRTGRALVPAIVGCVIAGLALAGHAAWSTVRGVERVTSLVQSAGAGPGSDGSEEAPTFTDDEDDYLGALADSDSDTYDVYTDPALVGFGHEACDALDGGEDADAVARGLDMGRAAAAEVVQVASQVLCPADGAPPPGS